MTAKIRRVQMATMGLVVLLCASCDSAPTSDAGVPSSGGIASCADIPADYSSVGRAACSFKGTCELGRECCCGGCFPSVIATCDDQGQFSYAYTDKCFAPPCIDMSAPRDLSAAADLPGTTDDAAPMSDASVSSDLGGIATCGDIPANWASASGATCSFTGTCDIGQECCCGACHPSVIATCHLGRLSFAYTDACFSPPCADMSRPPDLTRAPDL